MLGVGGLALRKATSISETVLSGTWGATTNDDLADILRHTDASGENELEEPLRFVTFSSHGINAEADGGRPSDLYVDALPATLLVIVSIIVPLFGTHVVPTTRPTE
jgi:hypothetical protein